MFQKLNMYNIGFLKASIRTRVWFVTKDPDYGWTEIEPTEMNLSKSFREGSRELKRARR